MADPTYQNPTFGTIKTKTPATVTEADFLATIEADGSIAKIDSVDLPISTETQSALNTKENASNKAIDFTVINDTLYPSVEAVKEYADSLLVGVINLRGLWDASTNLFPTTGGSGTSGSVRKGDLWYVSVAGILAGKNVNVGDSFFALVNTPGQTASNWNVLESNIGYVPANDANVLHTTGSEIKTGSLTINGTTAPISLVGNSVNNIGVSASSDNGLALSVSTTTGTKLASFIVNSVEKSSINSSGGYVINGITSTNALLAGGGNLANPNSGTGTAGMLPIFTGTTTVGNSSVQQISNGNLIITGGAGADVLYLSKSTGASIGLSGATGTTNPVIFGASSMVNPNLDISVGGATRQSISNTGVIAFSNLAGTGTRQVVADASGNLSATDIAPTSGTYTPTLTGTNNVSSVTIQGVPTYSRVGNIVTVSIGVNVDPTLGASTLTSFTATLPVTRGVSTPYNIGNANFYNGSSAIVAGYLQTLATTTVTCVFFPLSVASVSGTLSFQYQI